VHALHHVFLALAQPRGLEHPFQHEFAPAALRLARAAQGAREILGVFAQVLIQFHELANLLAERRAVLAFLHVGVFDLGLEFIDAGFQRIEQGTEIHLILLGEALGLVLENLRGERLELVGERLLRIEQQRELVL
jgi:hypothetical protein